MKLLELLQSCSFESLAPIIGEIDPRQANMLAFYKEAYDELLHTDPEPAENSIEVSSREEDNRPCGRPYIYVQNVEGDLWPRCLGKEIILEEGVSVSNEYLAAKILWHMTFYGFSHGDMQETFDSWHLGHKPSRKEKIDNLVDRILLTKSGLSRKDLEYLYSTKTIWEYKYHTRSYNKDKRIDYLLEEVIKYGQPDLLEEGQYLVLICSDSEYPLLMQDLPKIGMFIEHLQPHGEVTFDFGTKDGLDEDLDVLIVRTQN